MVAYGGYRPSDARPKSWQIAEGRATRRCGVPPPAIRRRLPVAPPSAIKDYRDSSSLRRRAVAGPPTVVRAHLDTGANMVSRTRERARDPLLVPALLALATLSTC